MDVNRIANHPCVAMRAKNSIALLTKQRSLKKLPWIDGLFFYVRNAIINKGVTKIVLLWNLPVFVRVFFSTGPLLNKPSKLQVDV